MVSNLRYSSFKGLNLRGRVPFVVMLAALLIFIIIVIDPPTVLLPMACIYCLSGPAMWLIAYRKSTASAGVVNTSVPAEKNESAPQKVVDEATRHQDNARPSNGGQG
jgi:hypothetical protein